jgi:hypothetical protein
MLASVIGTAVKHHALVFIRQIVVTSSYGDARVRVAVGTGGSGSLVYVVHEIIDPYGRSRPCERIVNGRCNDETAIEDAIRAVIREEVVKPLSG